MIKELPFAVEDAVSNGWNKGIVNAIFEGPSGQLRMLIGPMKYLDIPSKLAHCIEVVCEGYYKIL